MGAISGPRAQCLGGRVRAIRDNEVPVLLEPSLQANPKMKGCSAATGGCTADGQSLHCLQYLTPGHCAMFAVDYVENLARQHYLQVIHRTPETFQPLHPKQT